MMAINPVHIERSAAAETQLPFYVFPRAGTEFLRVIAIFLITNSHLASLYPIPQFATGGALGNSLFFMLSGYGLAVSGRNRNLPFLNWYWRRIVRIYPSLLPIIAIYFIFDRSWEKWTWIDYIAGFIWPTSAWFVSALMIFYIIFFILSKLTLAKGYLIGMLLLGIVYLYFYLTSVDLSHYTVEGPSRFKWIFYLQVMLFGGHLASRRTLIGEGSIRHFACLVGLLAAYFICGFLLSRGYIGRYQFLMHVITFPMIYLALILSHSRFIAERIMSNKMLASCIFFVSGITLEIYLLQYMVYTNIVVTSLLFPLNVVLFWIAVIVLAFILARFAASIRKTMMQVN